MDLLRVTVVISTRDRGESILQTIQTILLNDYPHFDLSIVDQSKDDSTEISLHPFRNNPRIRYVRTDMKGVSKGRNLGIRDTQSELIAIIDDDCEAPTNWVRELVAAFSVNPRIGIVFGNTLPGPHDRMTGFIPIYIRDEPYLARSIRDKHRVEGISACMGLRRSVWQGLCGFDEMLGSGAAFKSAAEVDFTIRALLTGSFVYETPKLTVVHHGFRTWDEGRTLIHNYWYGTGAVFPKQIKCGYWSISQVLLRLAWRWAFGLSQVAASFENHPHRWLRLTSFIKGFISGAATPVDKTKCQYVQQKLS
jgi:GT2 family glycosyltransferase